LKLRSGYPEAFDQAFGGLATDSIERRASTARCRMVNKLNKTVLAQAKESGIASLHRAKVAELHDLSPRQDSVPK